MATTQLSLQILRPLPAASQTCGRQSYGFQSRNSAIRTRKNLKWALRLSLVDQNQPQSQSRGVDVKQLVDFLYDDLPHLFDDQGIDRKAYDERVKFRDPITKHDSISGYLFNIALLKNLFRPQFFLHWVKQVCSSNNNNCLLEFLLFVIFFFFCKAIQWKLHFGMLKGPQNLLQPFYFSAFKSDQLPSTFL